MSQETILVVDDGEENREFVIDYILTPNGFNALAAKDGREGFDMALQYEPDLILLDLQMPRMSGKEVLQALANRNIDIPVVLMTFHGSEDIIIEMFRLGVKDYVKKPYTVEEMLHAIDRSLSEARLRREKDALLERLVTANRELQQRIQELNVLYRLGKSVAATVDMDKLLPLIIDAAISIIDAQESQLLLVENGQLVCRCEKRHQIARPEICQYVTDDPAARHVMENGRGIVAAQEHFRGYRRQPYSAAYAPLVLRGQVTGVLSVSNLTSDKPVFTQNDSSLLSALTDYAAIAIENSQNFNRLREEDERQIQQIRGTFERFVPPSVVEKALTNPDDLKLGGARQPVTIVFADIRGYTKWSEEAPPEKVMEMLNDYLSLAAELVMAWEGTLDKFFGDGLMAIFNAPETQHKHVHRAVDTALALLKAAEDLNQRKNYGLSYSVGIHTGEAVVGYMGTGRAMNYTAIGDVVNLAKRLQENAVPGQILAEETVIKELGDLVHAKKVGDLKIRHRKNPASVYRIDGLDPLPK